MDLSPITIIPERRVHLWLKFHAKPAPTIASTTGSAAFASIVFLLDLSEGDHHRISDHTRGPKTTQAVQNCERGQQEAVGKLL